MGAPGARVRGTEGGACAAGPVAVATVGIVGVVGAAVADVARRVPVRTHRQTREGDQEASEASPFRTKRKL